MTQLFLFDIEGTTTDISFVHKVLFPYSYTKMETFIKDHQNTPAIARSIEEVKQTVKDENNVLLNLEGVIDQLRQWIQSDRKHPALKNIQGLIWDSGYAKAEFKGHVYPDVKPFFEKILSQGSQIGIYSSGSVHAQKLIFSFSSLGDLTPMISYYFDTKVGMKRQSESYLEISHQTGIASKEIHFFSDIPEELQAAQSSGMKVTHVVREGTSPSSFKAIKSFSEM